MMKNLNRITLLLFVFILYSINNKAQDKEIATFGVFAVPQNMIINGMRIDVDFRIKNTNHWVSFAPQFYVKQLEENDYSFVADVSEDDYDFRDLFGFGLNAYHMIQIKNEDFPSGPYFKYGFHYTHFQLTYPIEDWNNYDFYGINTLLYSFDDKKTIINKIGPDLILGVLFDIEKQLYFDMYIGMGMRYSFRKTDKDFPRVFSRNSLDYGYTGTIFIGGMRIGFVF